MRKYLLHAFEAGKIDGFPCVKNRRVALGMRVRKSIIESMYCYCRMPNNKSKPMIRCEQVFEMVPQRLCRARSGGELPRL